MYEIEKGIKIPVRKSSRPAKYPWRQMELGDSFFVPSGNPSKMITRLNPSSQTQKAGLKFTRRIVEENGVKGVRIWRIK